MQQGTGDKLVGFPVSARRSSLALAAVPGSPVCVSFGLPAIGPRPAVALAAIRALPAVLHELTPHNKARSQW